MQVGVGGDAPPSVSIVNTGSEGNLGVSGQSWSRERFAVNVTSKEGTFDREALVRVLNLEGKKARTMGGEVCKDATALLPKDEGT